MSEFCNIGVQFCQKYILIMIFLDIFEYIFERQFLKIKRVKLTNVWNLGASVLYVKQDTLNCSDISRKDFPKNDQCS